MCGRKGKILRLYRKGNFFWQDIGISKSDRRGFYLSKDLNRYDFPYSLI